MSRALPDAEAGEPVASCGPAGHPLVRVHSSFLVRLVHRSHLGVARRRPLPGIVTGSLTELDCRSGGGSWPDLGANAGQVTYIQITDVYNGNNGPITTTIENAPAPVASFWSSPWDPSSYDLVSFSDNSYDPGGNAITSRRFDFGDGSSSTTGCSAAPVPHRRRLHGHADGHDLRRRTASVQQVVHVLTHDVAITKITLPQSASAGQSRELPWR